MRNICKSFGGVHALKDVSLCVRAGEIHALLGENGAGKSTLMKILSGAYSLDSGGIWIDGSEVRINSPKEGIALGVSVIYQELALMGDLTAAENIFIDNLNNGRGLINWKRLRTKTQEALNDLGFGHIPPASQVSELSIAYQQVVEICKALSRKSSILVLDEPTAVLSTHEAEQLFTLLGKLSASGVAIIYISHRLEEILKICDRATVLRDGENVSTVEIKDVDEQKLVNMMIGRDPQNYFPERERAIGEVVFEADGICRGDAVRNVSFRVRAGEVFGISGLVGAGRTETVMAILGEDKRDSGTVRINGRAVKMRSPIDARKAGVSLLTEDRKTQGVLLDLPILYNISLCALKALSGPGGVINRKKERQTAGALVDKLQIKIGSLDDDCSSLSGGNQQKVSISKLLGSGSRILLFDEPTRGVDVGAKIEIYKIISELVSEGYAIIMISSEMPEIIGMCDRVAVMRGGRIVGEIDREELSEQSLINLSMGVNG
jgi:ribose transport system ATP-binding protein